MSIRFPMYYNDLSDAAPTRQEYNELNHSVLDIMKKMANSNKVTIIHPEEKLYNNVGKCIFIVDGLSLYRDEAHLSTFGSHYVSTIFDDILKQIVKQRVNARPQSMRPGRASRWGGALYVWQGRNDIRFSFMVFIVEVGWRILRSITFIYFFCYW